MESISADAMHVCTICSQAFCFSKRITVDTDVLKPLQFLFAKINCSALRNTQMCESCLKNINDAYNFKMLFMEKKSLNIAIKIEQIDYEISCICYICKEIVNNSSSVSITKVLELIDYLNEEMQMELQSTEDSHICISCQESIVNFHIIVQLLSNFDENNEYNPNVKIEQLIDPSIIEIKEEPLMECANIANENSIIKNEPLRMENIDHDIKKELTHENEVNLTYDDFIMKNEEVDIKLECDESDSTEQMWKINEDNDTINPWNVASQHFTLDTNIFKFACDVCDYKTKYKGHLKRHMLIHESVDEIDMFACDACDYKTKHKEDLKKHTLKHKGVDEIEMFACDVCDYKAKHKGSIKIHQRIHMSVDQIEMYACDVCDYKTRRKGSIKIHRVTHSNVDEVEMFACDVCDYKAKHKGSIKSHMRTHMSVDQIEMFACDVCDYKTKHSGSIKIHMITHKNVDEIEMFPCNVCDYKAKRKERLKRHMLKHKNVDEIEMFACDFCDYKAKRKENLKRHMLKHKSVDEIKMFTCNVCDYKTKRKEHLKRHMLKHKSVETELFTCDICGHRTKYELAHKKHIILKHKNVDDIKIFTCKICEFKTENKETLKSHILIHINLYKL